MTNQQDTIILAAINVRKAMKTRLLILISCFALFSASRAQDSPVLEEPPDLDRVSPSSASLEWQGVSGAQGYQVQVCTEQNLECPALEYPQPFTTTESYYILGTEILNPSTTYYWRVRAYFGGSSYGNWSETWTFFAASGSGPADECGLLRDRISELAQNEIISHVTGLVLNVRVIMARTFLLLGNNNAAVNSLNAFNNQLSAFINNHRVPQETGAILNYWADYIIAAIVAGNSPILEGQPVENMNFVLHQNYPNPFNPLTVISYSIPISSEVSLKVYDLSGRLVETLVETSQGPGKYEIVWDANKYSSGTYIYVLTAGTYSESKKMLLMK